MYKAVDVIRGGGDGDGGGVGSAHLIGDGVGGIAGSAHLVVDAGDWVGGVAVVSSLIVDGVGVGGTAGAAHSDEEGGVVWGVGSIHRGKVVVGVSGVALGGVGGAAVCFVGACCFSAAISSMAERNMSLRFGSCFTGGGVGSDGGVTRSRCCRCCRRLSVLWRSGIKSPAVLLGVVAGLMLMSSLLLKTAAIFSSVP